MQESFKYLGAVEIFLLTSDRQKVLLMKRSPFRRYLPGYYAGLGGKMDLDDILESPIECAYREIEEESGISKDEIESLDLQGVITATDKFGKWFVYEFVGILKNNFSNNMIETDEGELIFVDVNKIEQLKLIPDLKNGLLRDLLLTDKFMWVKSYFDNNDNLTKREIL